MEAMTLPAYAYCRRMQRAKCATPLEAFVARWEPADADYISWRQDLAACLSAATAEDGVEWSVQPINGVPHKFRNGRAIGVATACESALAQQLSILINQTKPNP
jgi:hypothetical protein